MILHDLEQGSKAWMKHRLNYRNASESPMVFDVSPYKTREQFRNELVLGIRREPNEFIAERGHRWEALARPHMEELVGEDLFQVVGTEGVWSASFDGLTMNHALAAEHKMMNDDIRAARSIKTLPLHYKIQMEHQARVAGCDRVLFCATAWGRDTDIPEEIRHFWYEPDPRLWARIEAAWEEFEAEVRFYVSVLNSASEAKKVLMHLTFQSA